MSEFHIRLKELRTSMGLTQTQLADRIGKSKSTVNMYERGEREPGLETLETLADIFNVDMDYLLGKTLIKNKYQADRLRSPVVVTSFAKLPVIGELAAGYESIVAEDWTGETVDVPLSYLKAHEESDFIVLAVKGDSMYPLYHDGDRVLILKQDDVPHSGAIGAVIYDDEFATLKIVEKAKDKDGKDFIRLRPINPNHPPREIRGEALAHFSVIGIPRLLIREIND